MVKKGSASFFAKKETKKLWSCGLWHRIRRRPQDQKFFGSFFQKRTAFFNLGGTKMALADIDHFVVLMLENRSFDSLLGNLYPGRADFDGLTGDEYNLDAAGNKISVWCGGGIDAADMSVPTPDPGEEWTDINMQIFGVPDPSPVAAQSPDMSGFVRNYQAQTDQPAAAYDPKAVMHYYTPLQVPVISQLAQQFAVCDRWHASAPCQTWPNRFFVHTATANGYENNSPPHFPYDMKTIFTTLADNSRTWNVYFHDMPQSITLSDLWLKPGHFHFFEQFQQDAKLGQLPHYSFIEPRYFADASMPSDQHPPHDVTLGEQLIAAVYNAVRNGPGWAKTMLIITYDEHGGCFDHVKPPAATPPGAVTVPFNFNRYGVRVPAVLISPYIPAGTIFRPAGAVPCDHTSIIATLRERFGIAKPLTNRDAVAPHLGAVLSLPQPSNNGPGTISALPYVASPADVANARTASLNGHQAALLQLAAHLPATQAAPNGFANFVSTFLDHLRAGATGSDVSAINNVSSAVGFIKNRLGSFFASA
jgi:phospholipase C